MILYAHVEPNLLPLHSAHPSRRSNRNNRIMLDLIANIAAYTVLWGVLYIAGSIAANLTYKAVNWAFWRFYIDPQKDMIIKHGDPRLIAALCTGNFADLLAAAKERTHG